MPSLICTSWTATKKKSLKTLTELQEFIYIQESRKSNVKPTRLPVIGNSFFISIHITVYLPTGEAGVHFFHASGSEFDDLFVGSGSRKVRQLFGE